MNHVDRQLFCMAAMHWDHPVTVPLWWPGPVTWKSNILLYHITMDLQQYSNIIVFNLWFYPWFPTSVHSKVILYGQWYWAIILQNHVENLFWNFFFGGGYMFYLNFSKQKNPCVSASLTCGGSELYILSCVKCSQELQDWSLGFIQGIRVPVFWIPRSICLLMNACGPTDEACALTIFLLGGQSENFSQCS